MAKRLTMMGGTLTIFVGLAKSQTANRPELEVASIKPNNTGDRLYYKTFSNRFTARNMTANPLMQLAWRVKSFQVSGGDGWSLLKVSILKRRPFSLPWPGTASPS